MVAIKLQRLSITGLGQIRTSFLPVNVPEMPDRVSNLKRIALGTIESGGFLVTLAGSLAVMQVSLDLAQTGKRLRQINSDASLAANVDGLDEIPFGIGKAVVSARLQSLLYEFVGCL